jgi:hypothetical protein
MLLAAGLAPSAFASRLVVTDSVRVEAKEHNCLNLLSHQRFLWSGSRVHQVRNATGDEVLVSYTGSGEADFAAGSGGYGGDADITTTGRWPPFTGIAVSDQPL